ncbi:hypothetical protein FIBSPDRAFT_867559 [Athelia psychrophila]|uniref:Uncharacterized protein n=1 Tax=Athelia psychrophila TaxID=1759441 RepID=A0A166DUW2_9AGAM|nr:hypothetical protein FIBSPDRAFT_867559 [Fibularhizoctonia sp. CBS 109695]
MPGPAQQTTRSRRRDGWSWMTICIGCARSAGREHEVVRDFSVLKPSDVEHDVEPKVAEVKALYDFK